jgi:hypothetical protein
MADRGSGGYFGSPEETEMFRTLIPVVSLLGLLLACGDVKESSALSSPADQSSQQPTEPAEVELDAGLAATLKAADGHDGVEDQIISECSECSLAMEGDPEVSSTVGDYEIHFCGTGCKARFDEDPSAGIVAMQAAMESDQ